MKRAALRYAEILEKGAWVTHQEQAEIAKLLRSLVMTEDQAWDELEARLNRQKAIKQPEQEPAPVGMTCKVWTHGCALFDGIDLPNETLLYTAPPSKPWVSLTDDEIAQVVGSPIDEVYLSDFRNVEAKLKERNNG